MNKALADQLWNTDKEIEIAKDKEKKEGLFIRKRLESELDQNIDAIFDKLYDLYERSIIDKARIIFGSDLIELRFSNNPFCPKAFYLHDFLDLPVENRFDFDICSGIGIDDIEQTLLAIKNLRFQEKEYLEAFRLNSFSGNVWAHFCSSSSLITDYRNFLNYQRIRANEGISHEEAVHRMNFQKSYFRGDREFFDNRDKLKRQTSEMDAQIDSFIEIALNLFAQNKIFEIQAYLGSGVLRTITPSEPFTNYAFASVDELKLASDHYNKTPMTLEESLKNTQLSRPNLRMSRNLVHKVFQVAKHHRLTDETLYLRVFYIDFIYNQVLTSFSCGGTRYQQSEHFIDDYNKMIEPFC